MSNSFLRTVVDRAAAPAARSFPRHAINRTTDARHRPPPRRTPEPTPVEKRIDEVWDAMKDGGLPQAYALIWTKLFSPFRLYKNGNYGVRNSNDDVMTDKTAADICQVSERTIRRSRKYMAERFPWFGWIATPKGYSYQMQPDGVMPMRGKRGKRIRASGQPWPDGKILTKKKAASKGREPSTKTVCEERGTYAAPPDPVAEKLARLAAWSPTSADMDHGMRLGLTERDIGGEADRLRSWFVEPGHPERRAWVPVDPSAKFREWLERAATRKAIKKAEREAMERRRRAEAGLAVERRLRGDDDLGDDVLADGLSDYDDGADSEGAWRLRLTGSDDPPPESRAAIFARMCEIVRQHQLEQGAQP